MARANRLYEQRLGNAREMIGHALATFLGALESQDPDRIHLAQAELRRVLDRHDDEFFL